MNADVDNVRCKKDYYGNLIPITFASGYNLESAQAQIWYLESEPEEPEESYYWI